MLSSSSSCYAQPFLNHHPPRRRQDASCGRPSLLYKKIEELVHKLKEQNKIGKTLKIVINEQEAILVDLIKNNNVLSNKNFIENHKKLEFEVNYYMKKYKRLKKQIFDIVENVMKQKVQKKLI